MAAAYPTTTGLIPQLGAALYVNHPRHDDPTPFHDHDFHEIAVVMGGGAIHQSIHGDEAIGPGDVLVIRPGQWHGFRRCATLDLYNLCLSPGLLERELAWMRSDPLLGLLLPTADPGQQLRHLRLPMADLPAVAAALERMIELAQVAQPLRVRPQLIGQATVALGLLAANLPLRHVAQADDARISSLAAQIDADLAHPWSLDGLAALAGCTREHLCRRFRRIHGAAPMTWLARRRAERAAVLLVGSDTAIAAIGRSVGWSDANLFARRFRQVLGFSPSAFRARHRTGPG